MKLLAVLAVIVLVIVGLAIQERRELEKERMRRAKELSLLLQEPTEDPASCEHQWVEYLHGDCYSDYEGQNQWSAPNKCASYTIYKCAKCHATSYTCSCMHHDDRVLTGWDACVGCEYTPNSPGHLREPQPEPSRER